MKITAVLLLLALLVICMVEGRPAGYDQYSCTVGSYFSILGCKREVIQKRVVDGYDALIKQLSEAVKRNYNQLFPSRPDDAYSQQNEILIDDRK